VHNSLQREPGITASKTNINDCSWNELFARE